MPDSDVSFMNRNPMNFPLPQIPVAILAGGHAIRDVSEDV